MIRIVKYAFVTEPVSGTVTAQIKIPGTFSGINRGAVGTQGRLILEGQVEFNSPSAGDCLSNLHIEDIDGVIPASGQAAFPNYPIIGTRVDPQVGPENDGLFLSRLDPTVLVPPDGDLFIPSGLYLVAFLEKAAPAAATAYVSLRWDDLV